MVKISFSTGIVHDDTTLQHICGHILLAVTGEGYQLFEIGKYWDIMSSNNAIIFEMFCALYPISLKPWMLRAAGAGRGAAGSCCGFGAAGITALPTLECVSSECSLGEQRQSFKHLVLGWNSLQLCWSAVLDIPPKISLVLVGSDSPFRWIFTAFRKI